MGITGIGIAGIITNLSVLVYNLVYSFYEDDVRQALIWPDKRCLNDLKEYFELGIMSAFSLCLDCWAGGLVTFFAAYISVNTQSAQVVLTSIMVFLFMVGEGLS